MRVAAIIISLLLSFALTAQTSDADAIFIKEIHDNSLTQAKCYDWLTHLSEKIGGRLAGSKAADDAVLYTKEIMDGMELDKVSLQPCTVKEWHRNDPEIVRIKTAEGEVALNAVALGNSIGTGTGDITADIVEVQSLDEVEELGRAGIEGKIVFYNRPMNPTHIRTFHAYGGAVDQRVWGASKAAEYGGVAAIVRSMTLRNDDIPHTGTLAYKEDIPKVPGLAISTLDADLLSKKLKESQVQGYIKTNCTPGEEKESYNVIGEITGSKYPDEIIVIGGHLDSWDIGGGAHDDGAGCVHSLQVIQNLLDLDYKPLRTIRCVMFMNEENGLAGGKEYARASNEAGEYHMAAIESDAGGFVPRGFSFDADTSVLKTHYAKVTEFLPLLESYGLYFTTGGSGADIGPLKSQKGILIGLRPDSQRYFDYHHTRIDRIEAVNKRELELGAAAMTSLVYLLDKYGI